MEKEILKIKSTYEEFLKIVDITELCERKFKREFNIGEDEEYQNPFRLRYDFEKVINEVKGNVISKIISIFHNEFPNVDLSSSDFEKFIEIRINKYNNKEQSNKIYFEKIIKYLEELKSRKEILAKQNLLNLSFKLIPYKLREEYNKPREFKAEEIIRNKKLILSCYENDKERIKDFLKLISVILNGVNPATAEAYDCYTKHYKNNRLDIELNKKDVWKVGRFLEEEAKRRFTEYTKQEILNKLK